MIKPTRDQVEQWWRTATKQSAIEAGDPLLWAKIVAEQAATWALQHAALLADNCASGAGAAAYIRAAIPKEKDL